jgi:hypothetical protein
MRELAPGPLRTVRLLRARAGQLEAKVMRLEGEVDSLEKILSAHREQMSAERSKISSLNAIVSKMTDDYNSLVDEYDRQQDVAVELAQIIDKECAVSEALVNALEAQTRFLDSIVVTDQKTLDRSIECYETTMMAISEYRKARN